MKPTERFTQTVEDYIKYRPSYPPEVLQLLIDECGLTKDTLVADIGSGTGLLSKLLLDHGNVVYGVEPNAAMRQAAANYLKSYTNFHSIDGTAEQSTLPNESVDLITVGTAFHWFDAGKAKIEFQRILKSPGWVLLVWNVRAIEKSALIREYEELIIQFGKDYRNSRAEEFDKTVIEDFFYPYAMNTKSFGNVQIFDWTGFQGRLLSASYSLRPGDLGYPEMIEALKVIFDRHQQRGVIEFRYDTKVYYGQLR